MEEEAVAAGAAQLPFVLVVVDCSIVHLLA
jgi:hypothetical protein